MSKSITMVSSGGYRVQTVHTVEPDGSNDQYFRVTGPYGFDIPLNPWDPRHSPEIRTIEQLTAVLAREGEDLATLEEAGAT